jgi:hypothetical protein
VHGPHSPHYQQRRFLLVDTYRWLAVELQSQQHVAEAEATYQKAVDALATLTAQPLVGSPNDVQRRQTVDQCFTNLIQLLTAANRTGEARHVHEQAIALYENLANERPNETYFGEALEKHQAAQSKLKQ